MLKNENISSLDLAQIHKRTLDAEIDAQRVVIVGQELNQDLLLNAVKEGLKDIKIESSVNNNTVSEIKTIEIPVIVKETEIKFIEIIKHIEIPVIQRIEVPVVVKEIQTIEIEKPIYITETKVIEIEKKSNLDKYFLVLNILLLVLLAIKK